MEDKKVNQFDTRLMTRRIREGTLSKKEINKHLSALPDMSKNAEEIRIEHESILNGSSAESESPTFDSIEFSE